MAPHSSTLAWKIPRTEEPVGCSPWGREESDTTERLPFHFNFHALEKEMATYSSVLVWRIPGTEEPGGLPFMGSHRVGHPTISSSVIPFSSHLQSFPASGFFPVTQLFTLGGQSIGASASATVLPMSIQS